MEAALNGTNAGCHQAAGPQGPTSSPPPEPEPAELPNIEVWNEGYGTVPTVGDLHINPPDDPYPLEGAVVHVRPRDGQLPAYPTIQEAVTAAASVPDGQPGPGDKTTIVIHEGDYPETVKWTNKNITLQPAEGAKVWLTGADQLPGGSSWTLDTETGLWWQPWPYPNANDCDPDGYEDSDVRRNTAPLPHLLFRDGQLLKQVPHWHVPPEGEADPDVEERDCLVVDNMGAPVDGGASAQARERTLDEQLDALGKGAGFGEYVIDEAQDRVYVRDEPGNASFQAGVRRIGIRIEGASNGSQILGIGVRQYASWADTKPDYTAPSEEERRDRAGAILISSVGVTVSDVTAGLNAGAGVVLLGGPGGIVPSGNVVEGSTLVHNGAQGLIANTADGLTLTRNVFAWNNTKGFASGWAAAGAKVTSTLGGRAMYNLAEHNGQATSTTGVPAEGAAGLWCDLSCADWQIVGNRVRNNLGSGIFYEVSRDAVIASNLVHHNQGRGIVVGGSPGVKVWNNTVVGSIHSLLAYRELRGDPVNAQFRNNIAVDGENTSWMVGYRDYRKDGHVAASRDFGVTFDHNAYQRTQTIRRAGQEFAVPQHLHAWDDSSVPLVCTDNPPKCVRKDDYSTTLVELNQARPDLEPSGVEDHPGFLDPPGAPAEAAWLEGTDWRPRHTAGGTTVTASETTSGRQVTQGPRVYLYDHRAELDTDVAAALGWPAGGQPAGALEHSLAAPTRVVSP